MRSTSRAHPGAPNAVKPSSGNSLLFSTLRTLTFQDLALLPLLGLYSQICPNASNPQGCSFCICVLSCYLIQLFLYEFVLNWPQRLAYVLQVYATFPCSCNRKILTHWGNCSWLQRLELCCVFFVVQWGWLWDRCLYFSSERDAQNKALLDLQTNA